MAEYENHQNTYGLGVAGTTLGSIGTALGLVNGGLSNLLGGGIGTANAGANYVTKEAFEMAQQIASKDSEIALLKSEQNTEVKITEIYKLLKADLNNMERTQNAWNANQQVFNNQITNTVAVNSNNIAQLMALTKLVVPATSVCPQPMPQYNSWTAPTTPTTGS